MRVLVTGGGGFIGSAVVLHLLERGDEVRVLAAPGEEAAVLEEGRVRTFRGDITRLETLREPAEGAEVVIHLAAVARDWGPWDLFQRVNVQGTGNVIRAAEEAGVRRLVHMSSLAVHRYRDYFGADESAPRDAGDSHYGVSKRLAEEQVERARDRRGLETVVIRPALLPYGPRDPQRWGRILAFLEKGRFAYVGGGRGRVGVIHVDDLARGLAVAATHAAAAGGCFVLSDPQPLSWREIMETLCRELGVAPPRLSVPRPLAAPVAWGMEGAWRALRLPGEPPLTRYRVAVSAFDLFFRPARAQQDLGFRTQKPFSEGARELVAWYRSVTRGAP